MEKSCGCIIIDEQKVLLVQQCSGNWGFPKGHVEENETEYETAIREVKEETNLDVQIIKDKRYQINYDLDNGKNKEVVFFVAKLEGGKIKPQNKELIKAKWMGFQEALETITYDNTRKLFEKVLKDEKLI